MRRYPNGAPESDPSNRRLLGAAAVWAQFEDVRQTTEFAGDWGDCNVWHGWRSDNNVAGSRMPIGRALGSVN